MNELSILNRAAAEREHEPGFLRRQFAGTATHPQITFDILVGIVLPVLCLVYDPIVFRGGLGSGGGFLKDFQLFAYSVIGLEVLTLMLWLWWGARAGTWLSAIGGILVAGALFSFTIARPPPAQPHRSGLLFHRSFRIHALRHCFHLPAQWPEGAQGGWRVAP